MFRPGLGQEHPHGAPRAPFPGPPPRPGMQNPNQFRPPFVLHGRGSPPGPAGPPGPRGPPPGPPQQFPGPYPGPPGPPPLGNPLADHLLSPAPQSADQNPPRPAGPAEEAPLMPRDPEMLKNIDILSSFVVKNGPKFEDMAREKQSGDPKFGFLFGGEPGTEAAIGKAYYEWKKRALFATFRAQALPQALGDNGPQVAKVDEAPASPDGSDMDMEDDFEEPSAAQDRKMERSKGPKPTFPSPRRELAPAPPLANVRPQGGQDPRVPIPQSATRQGNPPLATQASPEGPPPQAPVSRRPQTDSASAEMPRRKDTRRRTGFDRPCMEDVTPGSTPPRQTAPPASQEREPTPAAAQDHKPSLAGNGNRAEGASRLSRWGPREPSPPATNAPPAPTNVFEHLPERSPEKQAEQLEESHLEDQLEAVTPVRDDDSEWEMKDNARHLSKEKLPRSDDKRHRDSPARSADRRPSPSPRRPDDRRRRYSPPRSDDRRPRDSLPRSEEKRPRDSPSRLDERRPRDRSPEVSKHRRSASGSDARVGAGAGLPTVDEFGRFVQKGGSESDPEDSQYHRKRRRSLSRSKSRSRSPTDGRRRHWSRSRSPRRRSRRSRSRSRSARRSRSPPRRGGERGRGGDHGLQDRGDRGGRRGGRGDRGGGGAPPACLDHARGRCYRGSTCRFLHSDNANGSPGDVGQFDRGAGRGGRGGRRDDRREDDEERDQGWGGGGSSRSGGWGDEPPRRRSGWEPDNEKDKDYKEDRGKLSEGREREQPETSPVSVYEDDVAGKPSQRRDDETHEKIESLPPPPEGAPINVLQQLPPPPPIPASQQTPYGRGYPPPPMMQSGFSTNLPPPPPPQGAYPSHPPPMQLQPPYMGSSGQQPGYPHAQASGSHTATLMRPAASTTAPQTGGQNLTPPARPGLAWPPAPATMAYSMRPMQVSTPQPSYAFPPPPPPLPAGYTGTIPQYQFPQQQHHPQASKQGGQFNPTVDGLEPGPPGAGEAGKKLGQSNAPAASLHGVDPWKGSADGNGTHMGDVGMVILESVSPGLPGHHHMESVSPGPPAGLVMESVSPATVPHSSKPSQQGTGASTFASSRHEDPRIVALENVSPAPEGARNWSPASGGENNEEFAGKDKKSKRDKEKKRDKEDHKVRGLTLLRTAVAEHVKDVLKPTWREGHMSKEAFKTIAKKAVDKVLGAIQPHQVPKTEEKVAAYMLNARPKIAKLVQGYVDKYVKT